MMKRVIAWLAVLAALLALVACGGETPAEEPQTGYTFTKGSTKIAVGADTASILTSLGKELKYYESPSCYFSGMDKIYTYAGFEIHTYPDPNGNGDRVNRIILLDDTVQTEEGVYIGSAQASVLAAYGEATEKKADSWDYRCKDMYMRFFFENGVVKEIQYLHPQAL